MAERTLQTLLLFKDHKTLSLSEISQLVGISQAATYRIVTTLWEMGFLKRDQAKRYTLDTLILKLSSMIEPNLRNISKPIIQELAKEVEESIYISVPSQNIYYIFIEKEDSPYPLQWSSDLGDQRNIYAGSPGKTHLAFMSDKELEELLPRLELNPFTDTTIANLDKLKEELAEVRKNRYAFSRGEHKEGVIGISVPIFDAQKRKNIAVLSTFMAESRYKEHELERYILLLQKSAEEIGSSIWE